MKQIEIPLLSRSDIIGLDLGLDDRLNAVEQAMCEHSAGIGIAICHIALGRSFPLS